MLFNGPYYIQWCIHLNATAGLIRSGCGGVYNWRLHLHGNWTKYIALAWIPPKSTQADTFKSKSSLNRFAPHLFALSDSNSIFHQHTWSARYREVLGRSWLTQRRKKRHHHRYHADTPPTKKVLRNCDQIKIRCVTVDVGGWGIYYTDETLDM